MYSKITHNIVEEHFGHPMAGDLKKTVDKKLNLKTTPGTKTKSKGFYLINDNECYGLDQFEKHSINAWSTLANRISSVITSISSGSSDVADTTTQLIGDIGTIAKLIAPIATDAQVTQFTNLLTTVGTSLLAVVTATIDKKDTATSAQALKDSIAALATFLHSLNPAWPVDAVTSILTKVTGYYVAQAQYRSSRNWVDSLKSADAAYKILAVSQEDGSPSFADIFAMGIAE